MNAKSETASQNSQETEFATFGFINKKLRAGVMIGLLSLSLTANVFLVKWIINMQGELYEKMLNRVDTQTDKKLTPAVERINHALDKVESSTINVDSASNKLNQIQEK